MQLEPDNRGLLDPVVDDLHADLLSSAHVELAEPVTIPARGGAHCTSTSSSRPAIG